jgi:hypothetical protein
MKKIRMLTPPAIIGPLSFLVLWVGFCTFLLSKYAGYLFSPIS